MRIKRKIISLILAGALIFTLFSCSQNVAPEQNPDNNLSEISADADPENLDELVGVLQSASYAYLTSEEVEEMADLIFVGEFTGETKSVVPDSEKDKEIPGSIYTDYIMKALDVVKGEVSGNVNIRMFGGEYNGIGYARSDNPEFNTGEKYYMYLVKQEEPLVENDVECYFLIGGSGNCFDIDDNGNLDITYKKNAEDKQKIESLYKANVDTAELARAAS